MARFESPCQIVGLFLGAACVSLAVILVLRAEAEKRYGEGGETSQEIIGKACGGDLMAQPKYVS